MGERGPVPKRSDQRRRANAPAVPIEKPVGAAPPPELALEAVHPLAASLYESLKGSVEARYFTPAVWQRARVNTLVLSNLLYAGRMSAPMYVAIQSDWKSLLVDPGEQRRLGIEVQRAAEIDPDEEAAEASVSHLFAQAGG